VWFRCYLAEPGFHALLSALNSHDILRRSQKESGLPNWEVVVSYKVHDWRDCLVSE
jgi:hypothetical protein